jgi:hypothetical protein
MLIAPFARCNRTLMMSSTMCPEAWVCSKIGIVLGAGTGLSSRGRLVEQWIGREVTEVNNSFKSSGWQN